MHRDGPAGILTPVRAAPLTRGMRLRLTAGQACFVHGWLAPKRHLAWEDVLQNEHMTLAFLLSARIPVASLHQLQPDAGAWIRAKRAFLADCPAMHPWAPHPVHDFRADLGDIIETKWSADTMLSVGLTYRDLVDVGLAFSNMGLFSHISLLGWAQLGLTRADVAPVPEPTLVHLFGLSKLDVMRSLK